MNRRISGLTLSLLAVSLAGCSMLPDSRKIEYKSAGKVPTLEVPPDLNLPSTAGAMKLPPSVSASQVSAAVSSASSPAWGVSNDPSGSRLGR